MEGSRVVVDPAFPGATSAWWLEAFRASLAERGCFAVAFAGGTTPHALYRALAASREVGPEDWRRVHAFLGDERPVAPDHPDSNWAGLERELLSRVPIPEDRCYRPRGESADLVEAARSYEESLLAKLPLGDGGVPIFDLVLLGMGPDGHIASLFPGTGALSVTDRWFVANRVPALGLTRLTLTYPVLHAARAVWMLVTGLGKAGRLLEVLKGEGPRLPASRIADWGHVRWVVDQEVAAILRANGIAVQESANGSGGT
jgi:6-phosphogluconolactonase